MPFGTNDEVVSPAPSGGFGVNDEVVSRGTTGSFGEPEATTYEQAAAPRQEALPADASAGQKIAAGGLDALSFVGRAIASSPTFLGALHGSGGNMDYALQEFYKDLGKKHSDNFVENTLRDPATVATLPIGGAGGKAAAAITKEVIGNVAGRVAAKVGVRAATGAAESIPSAASHQLENVAEGKPFDFSKAGSEIETGAGFSAGMGTAADALSTTAKATALKTISAYLRPGQKGARDGFDPENIFKHNLDAASIDGMFNKTRAKTEELRVARDAIKESGTTKGVTVDAPAAFHEGLRNSGLDETKNMYDQPEMKKTAEDILNVWAKKYPDGDIPISDAMDLKAATGNKAASLDAFDKRGDKTAGPQAKIYAEITKALNKQINEVADKNGLGNLAAINKQYEEVLPVMRAIIRRKPILKSNLPISLQDVAEGGAGAITAPDAASSWDKTLRALGVMAAGKLAANPKTTKLLYNSSKSKLGVTGSEVRQAIRTDLFDNLDSQDQQ